MHYSVQWAKRKSPEEWEWIILSKHWFKKRAFKKCYKEAIKKQAVVHWRVVVKDEILCVNGNVLLEINRIKKRL